MTEWRAAGRARRRRSRRTALDHRHVAIDVRAEELDRDELIAASVSDLDAAHRAIVCNEDLVAVRIPTFHRNAAVGTGAGPHQHVVDANVLRHVRASRIDDELLSTELRCA